MGSIDFIQPEPVLENTFQTDSLLKSYLSWKLPRELQSTVSRELQTLGGLAAGEMLSLARTAELNEPRLISYSAWGRRQDLVEVDPAWRRLGEIAATEGVVASAYEKSSGVWARLIQAFKLYLYHPSSAFFSCPLAMTDGAAKVIEMLGDDELKKGAFKKLISRDSKNFWTSGQWMTEKTGGSDVGETSTMAMRVKSHYELHGIKWFTSSITSEMALALARIEGAPSGSKGLSLFYVETHIDGDQLNNIEVLRLKNKMGTKALPTAELFLRGTKAKLIGEPGQGVKNIATMLNITRLYNSICSLAHMNRAMVLSNKFANTRKVFGSFLSEQPLYKKICRQLESTYLVSFLMTFTLAEWLGKVEQGESTQEEKALVRLLIPILKMFTAKHCLSVTSECLEVFGGAGYVEDTGIPVLMRDAQVFPIWEGATNVLSLDVLRVLEKDQIGDVFQSMIQKYLDEIQSSALESVKRQLAKEVENLSLFTQRLKEMDSNERQENSRELAFLMGELFGGTLLAHWAQVSVENKVVFERLTMSAEIWTHRLRTKANFLT